jgi:hypothetical protein
MAYLSEEGYYENESNWGSYQYVSLEDIVNNFMLMNTGNHSLINNEERYKIIFHAKRAIQELNYDAFKNLKVLELDLTDTLRFILPSDFVNWVRINIYKNGFLFPLTENIQVQSSVAFEQTDATTSGILFDQSGNAVREDSDIDTDRLAGTKKSIYLNPGNQFHGAEGWCIDGDWYFSYRYGKRYGLNTETANKNPTFEINRSAGVINFGSEASGETVIVEYISDGMEGGSESSMSVNKLFEKYVYAYITYEMLNAKLGVQEYIVARARKEKQALFRNAKIRLSNIDPGKLLMTMRGRDKWLK